MRVSILDDYHDTLRTLACFKKLKGHDVEIWNDHVQDVDTLAERLKDTEALVLIRERTEDPRAAARPPAQAEAHQPAQRLSAHRHRCLHPARRDRVVEPACRRAFLRGRGVDLGTDPRRDAPDPAADGRAQGGDSGRSASAIRCAERRSGIYGYGRIGSVVAGYGKAFGMKVLVWAREASLARARADGYARRRARKTFFETVRRHLAAYAPGRCDARHRDRRRSGAHEADGADREHQPRAADRARRAGACSEAGRPGMAAVDVYEEEPVRDAHHPLLDDGQRRLHAAHRLRHRAKNTRFSSPKSSTRSWPTAPASRSMS